MSKEKTFDNFLGTIALIASLVFVASVYFWAASFSQFIVASHNLDAEEVALSVDYSDWEDTHEYALSLDKKNMTDAKTLIYLESLVKEHTEYVQSLNKTNTFIEKVGKKFDTSLHKKKLLESQNKIQSSKKTKALYQNEKKKIVEIHNAVEKAEKDYDKRQEEINARRNSNTGYSSEKTNTYVNSGGSWLDDMRSRLINVGGSGVNLYEYNGSCGGSFSLACTTSKGIGVHRDIVSLSSSRKNWAMAHELAHVYQLKVWTALKKSNAYKNIFGGNIEILANCMASVKGYSNHGHSCNNDRLNYAQNIWRGVVP